MTFFIQSVGAAQCTENTALSINITGHDFPVDYPIDSVMNLLTNLVGGFTGSYETSCTDVQDDTGTYDTVFCPELMFLSFCAPMGSKVATNNVLSDSYLFNPGETGDYCYCTAVNIKNYLPEGYSFRVQDNPTELVGFIINTNGDIAITHVEAATPIPPEPMQKCAYNCSNVCETVVKKIYASESFVFNNFVNLITALPSFIEYYVQ